MRLIPPASYRSMPWKNGGGVTTEIAVFPEGAGLDNFGWRISMAHVGADGPFSAFAGVDRTLCVLKGLGITLRFEGRGEVTLGKMSDPYSFAADAPCFGKLHGEPIDDLNIMSRRAGWRHEVERVDIYAPWECVAQCDVTALICVKGEVTFAGKPLPLVGRGILSQRMGGGRAALADWAGAMSEPSNVSRPPPPTPPHISDERLGEGGNARASLTGATLLLEYGERVTLTPERAATLYAVRLSKL